MPGYLTYIPLVPDTPVVQTIPYYSYSNQQLIIIHTTVNKMVTLIVFAFLCGKYVVLCRKALQ